MSDLLLSKLMPPRRGGGVIDRPELIKKITGGEQQLSVLTAPAGYGKTVTMLQAANVSGRLLAWYQLDSYDNDPTVFLRYLTASIGRQLPDFGGQVLSLLGDGVAGRQRLFVTAFIRELSRLNTTPLLLVLDDYHEITEPFARQFLEDLLLHLPEQIQVMLASRTLPPFNLYRLRERCGLLTVGTEDLRFTDEEVRLFLAEKSPSMATAACAALSQQMNGWPVAVRFLADACQNGAVVDKLDGGSTDLHNYLAAEVLSRQPADMVEFMQNVAVLDILTPDACNRLLDREDAPLLLDLLYRQNLFVSKLEGPEKAYRYHQLFREFLLERLGNRRQHWQKKAGSLARDCGNLNAAVEYYQAAGADHDLLDILKEAARQAFSQGRWQTVLRWLKSVDDEKLASDPWLSLYRARVEIYQGRLDEAEKWLNGLAALFTANGELTGLTESRLVQARLLRCRGHFSESLVLLEQVIHELPETQSAERFDLPLEKALCFIVVGRLGEAETVLTQALESVKCNSNIHAMAHIMEGLGNISYLLGNYPQALQIYQQAADLLPDRVLPSYYAQDSIVAIYQDWGELKQAFDYARRNVAIKENLGLNEALPPAYLQLAGLFSDRNEWDLAEEYYARAVHLLRKNNGERFFLALNLIFWAQCLSLQGRYIEARAKAEEAFVEAQLQLGLALAVCQAVGAVIFIQTGSVQEGKAMLRAAISNLEKMGFIKGLCCAYTYQAWVYCSENDPASSIDYTQKALELAAKLNIQQLFLTQYEMLQPVLQLGLENGLEVSFIQHILVRKGEQAAPLLVHLAKHADPAVRLRVIAPLAEIHGKQAVTVMNGLAGDPDTAVRQSARLAAQRMTGKASVTQLTVPSAASLQVRMLGPFQVFTQGEELGTIGWRTSKAQDLFAYLLHKGEPVGRDRIQEDLWPETDSETAINIFHVTLHRLRQALGKAGFPEMVSYAGKRYALCLDGFSSDVRQFQELMTAGQSQDITAAEKAHWLEQAVALYRGSYLEGMDYLWLLHEREKIKNLHIETRASLSRYYLVIRSYEKAITHLHMVEEEDPFNEEIHALLIEAYTGQGSRKDAVRQYQKAEALFRQELGLRLSPELQALYEKAVHFQSSG